MKRMRSLLLQLPTSLPGPQALYGRAWIDAAATGPLQAGFAPLSVLASADGRTPVVAIVPAAALSWHRVTLPSGLTRNSPRLQSALQGLLEDRLLQEASAVHIALPPQWKAGEPMWVVACDKAWLLQHVQALEDARFDVQRLVPEFTPPTEHMRWHATGQENSGWLWRLDADSGVLGWPVHAAALLPPSWVEGGPVLAEPGLVNWARTRYPQQTELVETARHWLAAVQSPWNLAQFELASRLRQRHWVRWRQQFDAWWHAPRWRPARWAIVALLLVQLAGLNTWAWMLRQQWQQQQDDWARVLQESFPQVKVVVDAPVQMANEVARLRRGSGQLTPSDFESMLQALGAALPEGIASPASLGYQDGVLQWPALSLSAEQKTAFEQSLARLGYTLQTQDSTWRLQARENRP